MSVFIQKYNEKACELLTEVVVIEAVDIAANQPLPKYFYTENAIWDTGAEITIISPKIVATLGLKPTGKGSISGIGGNEEGYGYTIHLGLPNNKAIHNLNVLCCDMEDYDVIIGMDVISLTDLLITNNPYTAFSFRYPSQGDIELK